MSLICQTALFCGLRISEVLGLEWRHVHFDGGLLMIRKRYYRGDLDEPKSSRGVRDVSMGHLADDLRRLWPGPAEADRFVFEVRTHVGDWKRPGITRDDRAINRHFLRPTAKALKLYYPGFGFHRFRRKAVTALAAGMGPLQKARSVGHGKADMSLHYSLDDRDRQDRAVRAWQEKVMVN